MDWEKLLDGHAWECVRGVDFDGEASNFRHYVLQRARTAGVQVKTRIKRKNGRQSVWVQKIADTRSAAGRASPTRSVKAPPPAREQAMSETSGGEPGEPDAEAANARSTTPEQTQSDSAPVSTELPAAKPNGAKRTRSQPAVQTESLFDLPQPDEP